MIPAVGGHEEHQDGRRRNGVDGQRPGMPEPGQRGNEDRQRRNIRIGQCPAQTRDGELDPRPERILVPQAPHVIGQRPHLPHSPQRHQPEQAYGKDRLPQRQPLAITPPTIKNL